MSAVQGYSPISTKRKFLFLKFRNNFHLHNIIELSFPMLRKGSASLEFFFTPRKLIRN
jgi:hypothetical protein